jgi:hypothetical protein
VLALFHLLGETLLIFPGEEGYPADFVQIDADGVIRYLGLRHLFLRELQFDAFQGLRFLNLKLFLMPKFTRLREDFLLRLGRCPGETPRLEQLGGGFLGLDIRFLLRW